MTRLMAILSATRYALVGPASTSACPSRRTRRDRRFGRMLIGMPHHTLRLALAGALACCGAAVALQAQPPQSGPVPTFAHDIAPVFFANCVTCHRPGEIAPMSLLTYTEAR